MNKILLFTLVILVFASGCDEMVGRRIKGNGNIVSENRSASGFNNIEVSGAIDVYVRQDSTTSIKVEADENLQNYIEVSESGSTLEIRTESGVNLRPSRKIKVYVSNPSFIGFEVSGASSIRSENQINSSDRLYANLSGASEGRLELNAPKVSVDLSGASNVIIRGRTRDFEGEASGASEIKCYDLLTENADVNVSGASHAEVYASVKIGGQASGASSVDYKGNAQQVNVDKSGASSVSKKD